MRGKSAAPSRINRSSYATERDLKLLQRQRTEEGLVQVASVRRAAEGKDHGICDECDSRWAGA